MGHTTPSQAQTQAAEKPTYAKQARFQNRYKQKEQKPVYDTNAVEQDDQETAPPPKAQTKTQPPSGNNEPEVLFKMLGKKNKKSENAAILNMIARKCAEDSNPKNEGIAAKAAQYAKKFKIRCEFNLDEPSSTQNQRENQQRGDSQKGAPKQDAPAQN